MSGSGNTLSAGFIGLGSMGTPMARQVLGAGIPLTVWGRTERKLEPLLEAGAALAATHAALASQVEVVLLCVSDSAAVEAVVFGENGIAAGGAPGKTIVDHSTIHHHRTREFAARLQDACGMAWIDAPVSGGVKGAEAGQLTVMAGGDAAALDRVRPVVESYSGRITRLGDVGCGQIAKACNQLIIGAEIQAIAEALTMARNAGLDPTALPAALADGWADSKVLQNHGRKMAAMIANPPPTAESMAIASGLMQKDMDIAADMARQTDTPMPLTSLVAQLYRMLGVSGLPQDGQIGLLHLLDSRQAPKPGEEEQ